MYVNGADYFRDDKGPTNQPFHQRNISGIDDNANAAGYGIENAFLTFHLSKSISRSLGLMPELFLL